MPLEIPYVTEDEITVDLITSESDFGTSIKIDHAVLASGVATAAISGVVTNIRPNEHILMNLNHYTLTGQFLLCL